MPKGYKQKVEECWEIRDTDVFNETSIQFLKNMRSQLHIMPEDTLTSPQKVWLDDLYAKACESPY